MKNPFLALIFSMGFGSGYFYYESDLPVVFSSLENSPALNVCFSPEGQCKRLAIRTIESAQKEILVQSYSFTSKPIAYALITAQKKGVLVKVLFDRSQLKAPYSQIHRLMKNGITAKVDYVPGIAHNKIIIVDGRCTLTGSYNFSKAANTKNAENMLLINDPSLAKIYRAQWIRRFNQNNP